MILIIWYLLLPPTEDKWLFNPYASVDCVASVLDILSFPFIFFDVLSFIF